MLTERKRLVRSFYDTTATEYSKRDEGARTLFHNRSELDWLTEFCPPGAKILDVGSGAGRLERHLRNDQPQFVVAVDLSLEMLKVLRSRVLDRTRIGLVQCDAEALPFPRCFFQSLICLGLFEYVVDMEPFLREFLRVIVPEGHLLFTCRNANWILSERSRSYPVVKWSSDAVQAVVCKSGFRIVRHETIYHFDGRGIGIFRRLFGFIKGDIIFTRLMLAVNQALKASHSFRSRGKTHLVLAQRVQ